MQLRGIIPATVLPMTPDARINEEALRSYTGWLLEQDPGGLAVNVDTGEGPHLWPEERRRVLEIVTEVVNGRVPIIAGLCGSFTEQAVREARTAEEAGADALLVFPLPAWRGQPVPEDAICGHYDMVADEVNIPLIAFQLQDALGGVEFDRATLTRLFANRQVVGIKEASFDCRTYITTLRHLRELPREVTVLTGNDNFIYESFLLGADGALIGFGTLATGMQVEMYRAHVAGKLERARELGERLQRLADVIFAPPVRDYRVRAKEALVMQGVIPRATARLPLLEIDEDERARIREALRETGLPAD